MTSPIPAYERTIQDLRAHLKDWKGHSLDTLGPLYLREVLTVHRASEIKEYNVHVFENALIFITENTEDGNRVLHLKGLLYMKHIIETSKFVSSQKMEVTITSDELPQDQALVTLVFKDETKLNRWRDFLVFLAAQARAAPVAKVEVREGRTATQPAETVSEKHVISRAGEKDLEWQIQAFEERTTHGTPYVQHRIMLGMVIIFVFCFLPSILALTLYYHNIGFMENNAE